MLLGANRRKLTDFVNLRYYLFDEDQVANKETGVICNILIPSDKKRDLIDQLDLFGINKKSYIRDLTVLAAIFRQKYSRKV